MRRLMRPFVATLSALPACTAPPHATAESPETSYVHFAATVEQRDGACFYTEAGSCPPPDKGTCNPPPPRRVLCPPDMPGGSSQKPPPAPAGKGGWLYEPPFPGVRVAFSGDCRLVTAGSWCPPVGVAGACTEPRVLTPRCVRPALKGGPAEPSASELLGVPAAPAGKDGWVYVHPFRHLDAAGQCRESEAIWCEPEKACELVTHPAEACP